MSYVVENVNNSTKKLVFDFDMEEIEAFDFDSQIQSSLKEKQKSVSLKGFRQGKAPLGMIKEIYGSDMEKKIFQNFMFEKIQNVVERESLEVVNILPVEDLQYEKGKSLSFKVSLEIVPTIELKDISGYVFTRKNPEVTDQELDNLLKNTWLLPKAEMREVSEEGAELGNENVGIVNYKGASEDGTVEMTEAEYWADSFRNDMMEGLWENILGMKKGEKKSFELVVSEGHSDEKLRGTTLSFSVELLEIKEKVLPELDDDFAKEHGFESAEKMKNDVRGKILERKKGDVENKLRNDVEEKLLEDNPVEVPGRLVDEKEEAIRENIKNQLEQVGYDRKAIKPYLEANKKGVREQALKVTRLSLIFRSLVKKYDMKISEEESSSSIEDKIFKKILENVTVHQETVVFGRL